MSKHIERPGRDLWAGVQITETTPLAPRVAGDKRGNYPAGEKLGTSQGMAAEVEAEQKKQSAAFQKMYAGEHTGEDAPTEAPAELVEVEGKTVVEKRRKAKDGES